MKASYKTNKVLSKCGVAPPHLNDYLGLLSQFLYTENFIAKG